MNEQQLKEYKRNGAENMLLSQAQSRIDTAKSFLNEAPLNSFKDFLTKLEKAEEMLGEAKTLWKETYKL